MIKEEKESLDRIRVEDTKVLDISELEKISEMPDNSSCCSKKSKSLKNKIKNLFSKKNK